jgi:FkbM family methyltransferase
MSTNSSVPQLPSPEAARELRAEILSQPRVYVYGAGSVGRDSISVLQRAGVLVRAVVDAKELTITSLHGVPLLKPDDPRITLQQRAESTLVIGIFNAHLSMPVLHAKLAALGWKKIIPFTNFHGAFSAELGNRYWLTSREYYRSLQPQLAAARALWADEKSLQLFDAIVRFRFSGDYDVLPAPDLERQYFPADLPTWPKPLRLVDCGAYDGDTLRQVRALGLELEAYAGFEPDLGNFAKLTAELNSGARATSFAGLWPCGVWSHSCQLRFTEGQGAGSALDAKGTNVIQCTALDEALPSFGPTVVKMDIEGAEHAALLGAARSIQTHRPGLAICLYHEPAHLWEIPFLIQSWNLSYRMYLRSHCYSGFDLVLYAIPN